MFEIYFRFIFCGLASPVYSPLAPCDFFLLCLDRLGISIVAAKARSTCATSVFVDVKWMYSRIKRFFKLGIDPVPYSWRGSDGIWREEDWRHDLFTTQFNPPDPDSELHLLPTASFVLVLLHHSSSTPAFPKNQSEQIGSGTAPTKNEFPRKFDWSEGVTIACHIEGLAVVERISRVRVSDYFRYNKSKAPDELRQMVPMIKVITETDISLELEKKDKSGKKCYL